MAGNPQFAAFWPDADVYIALDLNENDPSDVDTAFGSGWDLVGLLDGEAGFVFAREEEVDDHFAWGGIIVRTTRRNFKQTVTFTALEDNQTTRELIWPDSQAGELIVPKPKRIKLALETREGERIKRLITKEAAEIAVDGEYTESEGELTRYPLIATIFPDGNGVLFVEQRAEVTSS